MLARYLLLFVVLSTFGVVVQAQQATEMFIPIGSSPGVSGKASVVGIIGTVDADGRTFTVSDGSDSFTVAIPEATPVWLDRSRGKGPNRIGSPADLKSGLTVEVKYREASRTAALTAEWVKLAVTD